MAGQQNKSRRVADSVYAAALTPSKRDGVEPVQAPVHKLVQVIEQEPVHQPVPRPAQAIEQISEHVPVQVLEHIPVLVRESPGHHMHCLITYSQADWLKTEAAKNRVSQGAVMRWALDVARVVINKKAN